MSKTNPIQLQKYLKGVNYPASKDEIVGQAKRNGADEKALNTLKRMPDDEYQTPADISEAVGKIE